VPVWPDETVRISHGTGAEGDFLILTAPQDYYDTIAWKCCNMHTICSACDIVMVCGIIDADIHIRHLTHNICRYVARTAPYAVLGTASVWDPTQEIIDFKCGRKECQCTDYVRTGSTPTKRGCHVVRFLCGFSNLYQL